MKRHITFFSFAIAMISFSGCGLFKVMDKAMWRHADENLCEHKLVIQIADSIVYLKENNIEVPQDFARVFGSADTCECNLVSIFPRSVDTTWVIFKCDETRTPGKQGYIYGENYIVVPNEKMGYNIQLKPIQWQKE